MELFIDVDGGGPYAFFGFVSAIIPRLLLPWWKKSQPITRDAASQISAWEGH